MRKILVTFLLIFSVIMTITGCSSKEVVKAKVNYQVDYDKTYDHANKAWQELDKEK